jgi:branched-chain amino acid transport system substrate-binding protein
MGQAGVYSATRHYLRAVEAAKSLDVATVAAKMRELPVSDAVIRNGQIRDDGRLVHDMYLVEVRRPGETKDPWDLEKVQDTLAGNDVFRPLSESDCPLIKK